MSFEVMIKNIDHYIKGIFQLDKVLASVRMFPWFVGQYSMWDILPMKHVAESVSVTATRGYQWAQVPMDEDWRLYHIGITPEAAGITADSMELRDEEDHNQLRVWNDGGSGGRFMEESVPEFLLCPGGTRIYFYSTRTTTQNMRVSAYWKVMKKAQWKA